MRAVVYRDQGRFELDPEFPMPSVEQGEVLVKVRYCGVCGSDLHIFQNIGHVPSGGVMGHEISGLVTEIGSGVEKVRPGDRVTALPPGFRAVARSEGAPYAAIADDERRFYGVFGAVRESAAPGVCPQTRMNHVSG